MIRREAHGQFVLITQHDHALLAGRLARRFGNARFARPQPAEPTLRGIDLHDSGWPLHDQAPTLNARHLPLDVFETPRDIGLKVWTASVERAAAENLYSGLLVSLHVLSLSQLLADLHRSPRDQFEINKFQHREIERQEEFRRELGLPTDLPLKMGLAEPRIDPREDELTFNFRLLQAMDRVSLALCCTNEPFDQIKNLPPQPGEPGLAVKLQKDGPTGLIVEPWIFDSPQLAESIICRRLPATPLADDVALAAAYAAAPEETLFFTLREQNSRAAAR
jgi:hypothetical protein